MKPTRVLWVGDAVAPTGFARVTHGIVDKLHLAGFHVGVLGLAYEGGPHKYPYPIWKANMAGENAKDEDIFGFRSLPTAIQQLEPEVVVLFHDPWVVSDWIRILRSFGPRCPKIIVYCPIDGKGQLPGVISNLERADRVAVYTEFGKEQLQEAGLEKNVHVIPHGVDVQTFQKIDKAGARHLTGIDQKKWVVLNANRNQPRKRIDLTIKGFVQFAAQVRGQDPAPLLYLHMLPLDAGWDVVSLMQRECNAVGLNVIDYLMLTNYTRMPVSDADLNLIYNAADIGINTSLGEGWGLPAFEMAALGIPQILTDYSANSELWKGQAWMLKVVQHITAPKTCVEGGLTHEAQVAKVLFEAYNSPDKSKSFAKKALKMVQDDKYRWRAVARQFYDLIVELAAKESD